MDSKEIKSSLKKAREAIRQKEFKEALRHCKDALEREKDNYMALVLIAVSAEGLTQNEQALNAYKRAIRSDDSQVLAWQGLCSFYEKNANPAHQSDQVDTYIKMLDFHKEDNVKKCEVIMKLVKLSEIAEDSRTFDKIADFFGEYLVREDTVYDETVENLISFKLSIKLKQSSCDLLKVCRNLQKRYPSSPILLKHHIMAQVDLQIVEDNGNPAILQDLVTRYDATLDVTRCDVRDSAAAFISLCEKEPATAYNLLQYVGGNVSQLVCVPYLHGQRYLQLRKYDGTVRWCKTGLELLDRKDHLSTQPSKKFRHLFHMSSVNALMKMGDKVSLNQALEIMTEELSIVDEEKTRLLCGEIYFRLDELEMAKSYLVGESVDRVVLEGNISFQEGDLQHAQSRYERAMKMEASSAIHHVNLAKCLWAIDKHNMQCYTLLLKAAKLDPRNSETFQYLGLYYSDVAKDHVRARKCFQKSFDLDPFNELSGEKLCDLLNQQGLEEEAYHILLKATKMYSASRGKWAWLRLGLYQVKHGDPSVAIASLQAALRSDARDTHVWECLGEAYMCRGSLTASLKAFTKAIELNPHSIYCVFQVASIKQMLGKYTEAVEEYLAVLEQSENYVPALKGLGETYVLIAKSLLFQCFYGRARDTAELAVKYLLRGSRTRPDLACLWKLIGDACTILHVLPAQNFTFQIAEKGKLNKQETLEFGQRCYIRALKILPECSPLWHDVGVNYIYQSQTSSQKTDQSMTSPDNGSVPLAEKSAQALKKAIQLDATNHKHWTALGYVACQQAHYRPDLAQHCFIKSIQVERNNVVAWTNLAALYLKKENVKLAHEAFKVAQSLEPSYVSSWIGQAIVAEVVGHEDAMDLFRHTTELSNHIEGALGYGHWVCSVLLQSDRKDSAMYRYAIERMGALPTASDALARYIGRVQTNPVAYNMYGLLLERQKLYKTAAQQLKTGVELVEAGMADKAMLRDLLSNYARLLRKTGDYGLCTEMYERLATVNDGVYTFEELCDWALACYLEANYSQSLTLYSTAAKLASTDKDKSHVMAAIAMVLYRLQDIENTKTTLFHSSQLAEVSIHSLLALCALGFLQSDMTLAMAAIQELSKTESGEGTPDRQMYDVTALQCLGHIARGSPEDAKAMVETALHSDPHRGDLWYALTIILLNYFPQLGKVSAVAARNAVLYQHQKDENVSEKLLVPVADVRTGYQNKATSCRQAFLSAQKAVHLYPDKMSGWTCLTSAMYLEAIHQQEMEKRRALLKQQSLIIAFLCSQEIGEELRKWCVKQKVVSSVHANTDYMENLEELMVEFGSAPDVTEFFATVRKFLQDSRQ